MGIGLLLAGASAASGIASASAAKKGAKATAKSADAATELQRDIFEQTSKNYSPFLGAGQDALSAYLYEMGIGPKPTFGGTAPQVETITTRGSTIPGSTIPGVDDRGGMGIFGRRPQEGPDTTSYKVGEKTFSTLGEAEKWAKENKTGGREYGGYAQSPMARYLMEEGVEGIEGSAAAGGGLFSGATLEAMEENRRRVIGADTSDYFSKLFGMANVGLSAAGNQASAGSAYANNVGNLGMEAARAKGAGYAGAANAFGNTLGDMAGIAGYFGGGNPMAAYASPTMMPVRPQPNPFY